MLRRAVPKEPAAKARPVKRHAVAKAIDMTSTDASLFAGVSDNVAQKSSDAEQYYRLYLKHPWIRSCIRIIGNAVAQEGYEIVKVDGEDEKPLSAEDDSRIGDIHAFLRTAFVGKCNTFRKARKSTVIDGQTYGSAFWHRKYATVDGEQTLVGLERLDARFITPKLNKERTEIEGYTVRKGGAGAAGSPEAIAAAGNTTSLSAGSIVLPAEEVIMFSGDEGGDAVLGSPSPLEALDLTCAMDLNVRHFRNAMFRNGQAVGNVFINKDGDEDQVNAAVKSLTSMKTGVANAGKNLVLTGDWDIKSMLQQGRQDVDFIKGSELTIEEVCAVYSIPPSKLRDVSGSMGQAGKGEDDDTFEQECVLPIEENFYETVTNEILRKDFGIEDLAIVPARRNKLRLDLFDAAMKLVKFGGTGNQALNLVGLPNSDDPSMDVPLFIGASGKQGVVDDEIAPDQGTLDAEAQAGGVTAPTEVANNSAKGKGRFLI